MKSTLLTLATAMIVTVVSTTTTFAGPGHEHGDGKHAGGHMDHMNDVLQKLKTELGSEYGKPVPAASKEQLVLGKKVFAQSCVACHGASGKGDGPAAAGLKKKPADFTDTEHSKFYSDQGRIHIIKKGIAGTPMSGWEAVLNEQEIQSVHAYVRSLRNSANKEKHGHSNHAH